MTFATKILLTLALASFGCKDKPTDAPAPATAPAPAPVEGAKPAPPVEAAKPAAPAIALQAGESLEATGDLTLEGQNPVGWNPTPTDAVAIGFAFKGEGVRAVAATSGGQIEIGAAEFNAAYSGSFGATVTPDNKVVVVFRSNGGSEDPGFTAAWRVAWDAAAKRPVVEDKGDWSGDEKHPAWAAPPETK